MHEHECCWAHCVVAVVAIVRLGHLFIVGVGHIVSVEIISRVYELELAKYSVTVDSCFCGVGLPHGGPCCLLALTVLCRGKPSLHHFLRACHFLPLSNSFGVYRVSRVAHIQ